MWFTVFFLEEIRQLIEDGGFTGVYVCIRVCMCVYVPRLLKNHQFKRKISKKHRDSTVTSLWTSRLVDQW